MVPDEGIGLQGVLLPDGGLEEGELFRKGGAFHPVQTVEDLRDLFHPSLIRPDGLCRLAEDLAALTPEDSVPLGAAQPEEPSPVLFEPRIVPVELLGYLASCPCFSGKTMCRASFIRACHVFGNSAMRIRRISSMAFTRTPGSSMAPPYTARSRETVSPLISSFLSRSGTSCAVHCPAARKQKVGGPLKDRRRVAVRPSGRGKERGELQGDARQHGDHQDTDEPFPHLEHATPRFLWMVYPLKRPAPARPSMCPSIRAEKAPSAIFLPQGKGCQEIRSTT
ncbi:MAG: hypothetical protein MZV64_31815 [Ignavibacteriales bacterium]|nr:hypothetical protein [Ignavibacteriales bacterium]